MEYTFTHQKTELDDRYGGHPIRRMTDNKSPKRTFPQHKRSSTSDTRQNQLVKCPNSTSCSNEKFARVHTDGLTRSWSSSARPDACFHSTKEKRQLAASAEQGGNREDPQNKWFWQLLGTSPRTSLSGPAGSSQPSWCIVMASGSVLENRGEPNVVRGQPHVGWHKTVTKSAGHCSKANKEASW